MDVFFQKNVKIIFEFTLNLKKEKKMEVVNNILNLPQVSFPPSILFSLITFYRPNLGENKFGSAVMKVES